MPRENGMGPMGMGSMTGRAAGFCARNGQPGFMDSGAGRGCGFGRGRKMNGGFGRGLKNMASAAGLPGWACFGNAGAAGAVDEKQALAGQAEMLRMQLDGIQKRLEQLDGNSGTEG